MPRSENQKARMTAIVQIFANYSDDAHGLTIQNVIDYLAREYDIETTQQTIQSDFIMLDTVLHIIIEQKGKRTRPVQYFWTNRPFTVADLNCLIESAQMNALIDPAYFRELIQKLKTLCSHQEARHLEIKTVAPDRIRNFTEQTIENIGTLRHAITEKNIIRFNYPYYSLFKNIKPETKIFACDAYPCDIVFLENQPILCAYLISSYHFLSNPWWAIEKGASAVFRFFDINTIQDLSEPERQPYYDTRKMKPSTETIDAAFAKPEYPTYIYKKDTVALQCDLDVVPLVLSRYGGSVQIDRLADGQCRVTFETPITPEFYGWLFGLGTAAKVLTPLYVSQKMKQWLKEVGKMYKVSESN